MDVPYSFKLQLYAYASTISFFAGVSKTLLGNPRSPFAYFFALETAGQNRLVSVLWLFIYRANLI